MTSISRIAVLFCSVLFFAGAALAQDTISVGANVNMVTGQTFPNGDPFQRQQNEPSVAYSSRNSLHMLSGANDYRAVDVPGLPGGRETGDSWLSYFWSTNGGATWKSTLIPGYPQDPACLSANPPVLCDYAAGADPVVRAGVNGMFYYSGIVFERTDPSRSAIFVSRFIDLNNDEGGDPIRYLDTKIIDANNDGTVFLDKSWIGVDIPRDTETKMFSVTQRDSTVVDQTVACGNIYVGYAAIGGEGANLRSEIRMATSVDCGDSWTIQPISQPDTLNQGANIAIHPLSGDVHVVWRRFDTVESFLGISPTGCPASPASWEVNSDWPVSEITLGGVTYTIAQAQELLGTKHRGDESIKLAYEVIAAKLNLLTGGGDPVDGFNPWLWAQDMNALIADAEAWFAENPLGSDPKQQAKKDGQNIKKNIQEILQGSGSCADGGGTTASTTGDTNAIMVVSSYDLGQTFSTPKIVDESSTFDQGSTRFSFRTTAYPTVAADADGRIYVAWAARGYATIRGAVSDGDARIVISTSTDGNVWSNPYAIDEPNREGHQIKPSLLFAGGQLTLVYYDFRQDVSNIFEGFVIDLPDGVRLRHTVDVRVATALPDLAPVFTDYSLISGSNEPVNPSNSASRYTFVAYGDAASGTTLQVEYMVPNFPMFADGTTPFIGDYVDVAAPNLINDNGTWRFASQPGDVQVWQAVWSDNRDVIPPPDGDWSKYVAPIAVSQPSLFDPTVIIPSCFDVTFPASDYPQGSYYTGTRNQNVYSASISNGLIVAAPGNNRPLDEIDFTGAPLERGFVVYVQNTTGQPRNFRLSLPSIPTGIKASFAPNEVTVTKDIEIPPYSGAVATVFASIVGAPATEAIPVSVVELGGTLTGSVLLNSDAGAPDPLESSLLTAEVHNPAILNPAILNPTILNGSVSTTDAMTCTDDPAKCVLNPAIFNPAVFNPAVLNPAIFNPAVLNPAIFNPAILNPAVFNPAVMNPAVLNPAVMNPAVLNPAILNPAIFNPAIFNPAVLNPAVLNPAIMNPAVLNPAILNPAVLNPAILNPAVLNPAILNPAILNTTPGTAPQQVDVTFAIRNDGNATTAYDLNLSAPQLAGLDYELMVYRLNEIPVTNGCNLTTSAQQQLVFNQRDPLNNAIDGSFYLEPGQEVLVTFRVLPDVDADTPANPVTTFVSDDLSALVTAQPLNTDPATQPPADQFGPSAIVVPGTASGAAPANGGTLAAGQQVSVTATGFVRRGAGFALDAPEGSTPNPCTTCLLTTAPALSLIARINGGPWQFVGAGPTVLTATSAGALEFAVNDNVFGDNTGAFYVTVTPFTGVLPGLVNRWPGDGDATDSVGSNDGALFGSATFGPGVINQSFDFDGISGYMDIGRPLPELAGTVDFWVRRNDSLSGTSDVFFGSVGPNLQRTPTLLVRSGGTLLWEFNNLTVGVGDTSVPLTIGQWYHVAMTWQAVGANTQVKVYVDGTLVDTGNAAIATDFQADVYVGAYNNNYSNAGETPEQFAAASIDELEVYNRALSEAEIQVIYSAGDPGQLVSLWRAEGDALDSVGDNDGTLQGGTSYAPGRDGQAFSFSNSLGSFGDYVQVADDASLRMTTAMTMAAWIYPTSEGDWDYPIVVNKEGEYELSRREGGSIEWAFAGPDPAIWIWRLGAPAGSAPLNTWTHVAVTYDNGTVVTYVNGVVTGINGALVSGSPLPPLPSPIGDFTPAQNELRIGGRQAFPTQQYFNGLIDEVAIYDTALTPTAVQNLYNNAAPFTQFTDETAFLNASGATAQVVFPAASQEGTLSTVCNQNPAPDYVENNFTLRHACGFGYLTGEFTANLVGGEFIVDGAEQVDISMPTGFRSFGIRIEDGFSGAGGAGCPAHDSSFTLAFKDGNTLVGQILIDPPTNQGSFIGVTSPVPFDNVEIREVGAPLDSFTGAFCEDDYFGTIFAAP